MVYSCLLVCVLFFFGGGLYIMGVRSVIRGVYGFFDEGIRRKDFDSTHGLLLRCYGGGIGVASDARKNALYALNYYLEVSGGVQLEVYYPRDESDVDEFEGRILLGLYNAFNESKYSVWVLARVRDLCRAYLGGSMYGKLCEKNLGILDLDDAAIWGSNFGGTVSGSRGYGILSLVGDVGRYKTFGEMLGRFRSEEIRRDMERYVGLPDGMDEIGSYLVDFGDVDRDRFIEVGSELLMDHLPESYFDGKDAIVAFSGQDFWDGYVRWLVEPKYCAVAVCSYEGAAKHGEDTNWCTRFGGEGEHTGDYLDVGPLFVVYANEELAVPPGVASGIDVGRGMVRLCQVCWRSNGTLREVKDVKNANISADKLEGMYLGCFISALRVASEDVIREYEPEENPYVGEAEPEVYVSSDRWGQEIVVTVAGGDIDVEIGVANYLRLVRPGGGNVREIEVVGGKFGYLSGLVEDVDLYDSHLEEFYDNSSIFDKLGYPDEGFGYDELITVNPRVDRSVIINDVVGGLLRSAFSGFFDGGITMGREYPYLVVVLKSGREYIAIPFVPSDISAVVDSLADSGYVFDGVGIAYFGEDVPDFGDSGFIYGSSRGIPYYRNVGAFVSSPGEYTPCFIKALFDKDEYEDRDAYIDLAVVGLVGELKPSVYAWYVDVLEDVVAYIKENKDSLGFQVVDLNGLGLLEGGRFYFRILDASYNPLGYETAYVKHVMEKYPDRDSLLGYFSNWADIFRERKGK